MKAPREGGFTIVEALIAFVILVVVGASLYAAFGGSADHARQVELREVAALVARSALERIGPREIEALGTVEIEEMAGFLTRMTVSVAEGEPASPLVELRRIDVIVLGPAPERVEMTHFSTYRLHSRLSR